MTQRKDRSAPPPEATETGGRTGGGRIYGFVLDMKFPPVPADGGAMI
jgi:hypothetical protein